MQHKATTKSLQTQLKTGGCCITFTALNKSKHRFGGVDFDLDFDVVLDNPVRDKLLQT